MRSRRHALGTNPSWHDLAFALPLAMLAFTGLETVANMAEEARRPGVDLPRSVFGAIATVMTVYVAIAVVTVSAFPGPERSSAHAGSVRRCSASPTLRHELPPGLRRWLRFYVGITGALILLVAVTTSVSGFSRLAYSLGEHGQLPRSFGRLAARARLPTRSSSPPLSISSAIWLVGRPLKKGRRGVPREPLLVRRSARVHRSAAGGDQAPGRRPRTCRGRSGHRSR